MHKLTEAQVGEILACAHEMSEAYAMYSRASMDMLVDKDRTNELYNLYLLARMNLRAALFELSVGD